MNPDPAQRMSALQKANRVRKRRAVVKAELRSGAVHLGDVLFSRAAYLQSMRIQDLLLATPKVGRTKATRALRACWLSGSSTVGKTSRKSKERLLEHLEERTPTIELRAA